MKTIVLKNGIQLVAETDFERQYIHDLCKDAMPRLIIHYDNFTTTSIDINRGVEEDSE